MLREFSRILTSVFIQPVGQGIAKPHQVGCKFLEKDFLRHQTSVLPALEPTV